MGKDIIVCTYNIVLQLHQSQNVEHITTISMDIISILSENDKLLNTMEIEQLLYLYKSMYLGIYKLDLGRRGGVNILILLKYDM